MPNENNTNQEPEPNNEEKSETNQEETEPEEAPEHYEHMVDDAILGVMTSDDEGS